MRAIWADALLVVYLVATSVVLLVGWRRVPPVAIVLHLAVLVAMAAAAWLRVVPRWLAMWAPLIALLFLYTELPALIAAAGHARFFDADVMRWEGGVFGSQPALVWAARWPSPLLRELLHGAYLSYYAIIFAVPVALYAQRRQDEFGEAMVALMLTFVACFVCYIVFPVAGPRYGMGHESSRVSRGLLRPAVLWLLERGSSRGTAFPSSHVAVAVAQSILALRYYGRRGLVIAALSAGLALGAVYGGFHYAIDILVGAPFGALTCHAGLRLAAALRRRAQANASAPT